MLERGLGLQREPGRLRTSYKDMYHARGALVHDLALSRQRRKREAHLFHVGVGRNIGTVPF